MNTLPERLLAHPLTRGMDIDDPRTTALRVQIINAKPFLLKLYAEWYGRIAACFNERSKVLELGSGAGFFRDFLPGVITSDFFAVPGADREIDARDIPFEHASLDGIVMTNVLHHIPDCELFFGEAVRVVRPGGLVIMVEPWITSWSRLVYGKFHHEPIDTVTPEWRLTGSGPLSSANSALPWILFKRDRPLFEARRPELQIVTVEPFMPVAYLLSGGVSRRSFAPGWSYPLIRVIERAVNEKKRGMFAFIVLRRK